MVNSRAYARLRGVFGALFIVLGILVITGVAQKTHFNLMAMIPGGILGLAMIALGYVRIRAAIATWKTLQ
jgi:hypothetical protein